jgi:hypothetical protein
MVLSYVIRHSQNLLIRSNRTMEKRKVSIVGLRSEELVNQRLKNLVIVLIINLSTKD